MARALRRPILPALWVLGCRSCSFAPWLNVPAAKIADNQYIGMSCDALRAENDRLLQKAVDLRPPSGIALSRYRGVCRNVAAYASDRNFPAGPP